MPGYKNKGGGGSGGGGGTPPTIQWEPIAGGVIPLVVTVAEPGFNLTTTVSIGLTADVPNIALDFDSVTVALTPTADFFVEFTQGLTVTPSADFNVQPGPTTVTITPSVSNVNMTATQAVAVTPSLDSVAIAHTKTVTIDVQDPVFSIPALLAVQDTWVPEVALCPDDTNKNGTRLEVDGVAATKKDAYFQFKTDALVPAGATCTLTAATLTINVTTAPLGAANTTLAVFNNVTGTFDETTAICSTMPPASSGSSNQVVSIPAATGELVIALDDSGGFLTQLQGEMNAQRRALCRFTSGTAGAIFDFQSKDSGGSPGNAFGPRLSLTFSIAA